MINNTIRHTRLILALVVALSFVLPTHAERGNYTVGSGSGITHEAPVNNTYRYSFTEIIYRSNEINARAGWMESISFKYAYDVIMTEKDDVSIYLANTEVSSFESTHDWQLDELQLVYTGTLNCHNGWNTFQFDTVFFYTGGNLLVVIDDNSDSYDGEAFKFYFSNSAGNTVLRAESDETNWSIDEENPIGLHDGHLSGTRPDIQLCIDVTCNTYNHPHIELSDIDPDCPLPVGENYVITSTVTDGTPGYTYYWSGNYSGHTANATIPANGVCTAYALRLVVFDAMGCTDTAWRTFASIDIEPPQFQHPEITTTGATPTGEHCTYTLPDLKTILGPYDNCDIDTIFQTPPAGDTIWCDTNAVLTVRDRCGKQSQHTVRVTVPEGITAHIDHINAVCNLISFGTIWVYDINGGTPGYSIQWQKAEADSLHTLEITNDTIYNCPTGRYWATITDANGCWVKLYDSIWADYDIHTDIEPFDVLCHQSPTGYILTDNVHGGQAPYSYSWSNGCTDSNAYNLMPGNYTLRITDQTGCWLDTTVTVGDKDELLLDTLGDITHILCHGYHTGALAVTAEGGVAPYRFTIPTDTNTTGTFQNMPANTYYVQVIDALGCKDTLEIKINEPEGLNMYFNIHDLLCHNDNSGAIEVALEGATRPYTYSWSTGATTTTITGLAAGTYSLHVNDGNGCIYDTTVTVNQPDPFNVSVSGDPEICNGDNVTLTATATGGTEPYTFVWNGTLTAESQNVSPTSTTTYHIIGTDDNGCADTTQTTVTVKEPSSSTDKQTACDRYTWPLNGEEYTASTDTVQFIFHGGNSVGCDSTVTLNLTIFYSSIIVDTVLPVCINQLPLRVGNEVYSEPGVYHTTLTSAGGCDSTLTFTLVIRDTNIVYVTDSIAENRLPWFYRDRVYPTPTDNDIFVLQNHWGCDSTIYYTLKVGWACSEFLQFPSVITANGDGINDVFYIYGLLEEDCWPENRLVIYNQWGSVVYKVENIYEESEFWDPAADRIPAGTYFFVFRGQGFKGKTERRGSVEVLR